MSQEPVESQVVEQVVTPEIPVAATPPPPKEYPFSIGEVLGTAMRVTKRNLLPFFLLASVLQVPGVLLQFEMGADADVELLMIVLQIVTSSLTGAVVSYGVLMDLHGSRPSTWTCIRQGGAQVGRVLGVTLLTDLFILLGCLALVVPGIILALRYMVAIPVTVFENAGVSDAMKRSRELTDGRKGDLFLIALIVGVFNIAVTWAISSELDSTTGILIGALASSASAMYFAVASSVAYFVLRRIREGIAVPELATAVARIRK